jgi:CII-binding regulator of phage lambda lysogenization HflD
MPKLNKKDVAPERAPIFVQVARLGGEVKKYALNGDRTVEAALGYADIVSEDDDRIRVNGKPADLETELNDGDVLTVAGRIEGAL